MEDSNTETDAVTMKKVLKMFQEKFRIKLAEADVDIMHKLGKFQKDGNRPIISKFVSRFAKQDVAKSRRRLEGSSYVIQEDLTHINANLLEDVLGHDKVTTAQSDNGRIVALLKNNKKSGISRPSDLDRDSVSVTNF